MFLRRRPHPHTPAKLPPLGLRADVTINSRYVLLRRFEHGEKKRVLFAVRTATAKQSRVVGSVGERPVLQPWTTGLSLVVEQSGNLNRDSIEKKKKR